MPLTPAERARFAGRVAVEGKTSAAVQAACDRAAKVEKCSVGKAENVTIDGKLVPETKTERPAPSIPRLAPMGEDGILRW